MDLQPAHQTFIDESRELLRAMEEALLRLEKALDDAEALDEVFRAAHTIKGSSGVFGFDDLVAFTHAMENVLADVRAGDVCLDPDLIGLLLACNDHCVAMVDRISAAEPGPDAALDDAGRALCRQLDARASTIAASTAVALPQAATAKDEVELDTPGARVSDTWHISLRFGPDVLRNGMDPLSFVRYLATLGKIESVATLFDSMPAAVHMDPESCYIGMEIDFNGTVDKAAIEKVFEFVEDDCAIRILPPGSKVIDYIRLIESLPEDRMRLGELLVASGVLTRRELEQGLRLQLKLDGATPRPEHAHKLGGILVGQGVVQGELVDAALNKQRVNRELHGLEASFLRVRAEKLDELITLVGELVIAGAATRLLAQRLGNGELVESTTSAEALVEQVRDRALKLRMVPIGETFARFNRVVRDLGRELGKDVELVVSGGETELDKSMMEKIGDPLMHLVRNALDHGIEAPEVRVRRGKPARGRLHLNAYHDSGSIVIEAADDGAGLDRAKILARAVERGLVPADAAPSDAEIHRFVMEAGFSTADAVTNVSGRGVGMDVARRNVEDLRGTIAIDSVAGRGTTVAIRLPLTLAIIDGFLVGVGRATYVVPLDMVVECMELSPEERISIRARGYIDLRGEVLPLLRVRDAFGVAGEAGRRENIVVVQYAGRRAGLVVDALQGEFQTVIKPLGKLFERLAGISGSTILGTGEVALILDVAALVQRAADKEGRAQAAAEMAAAAPKDTTT
jgi:two-component system, chemotaxis family, sensor kinase CheA